MNHRDLNRKLNTILQELTAFLDEKQTMEHSKMDDLFDSLTSKLLSKEQQIEAIEKQIKTDEIQHQSYMENIAKTIDARFDSLQEQIQLYLSSHTLEGKKDLLKLKKEEELKDFRIAKKREKLENNHRIAMLDKEFNQKLKEHEVRFFEEEKAHKARLAELQRRLQLDLQRSIDTNVDAYSEIEKNLLSINDDIAIKDAKTQIKKIRTNGFLEQSELKKEHHLAVYEEDLVFDKNKAKMNLDDQIIREEYRLKLEELKAEIYRLDYEQSHAETLRDFENEEKLIEYTRENAQAILGMKRQFSTFYKEISQKAIRSIAKTDVERRSNIFELTGHMFEFDREQLMQAEEVRIKRHQDTIEQVKEMSLSMTQTIQTQKDFLVSFLLKLIGKDNHYRTQLYNALLIYTHNTIPRLEISYRKFYDQFVKMSSEFHKAAKQRFDNFKKDLVVSFRLIVKQIEEMQQTVLHYTWLEAEQAELFHEQMMKILMQSNIEALRDYKSMDAKSHEEITTRTRQHEGRVNAQLEETNSYYEAFERAYESSMEDLQHRRTVYSKKGLSSSLPEITKEVKGAIIQHHKDYKENIRKIEKNLDKKKKEEITKVQKETNDKIRIL